MKKKAKRLQNQTTSKGKSTNRGDESEPSTDDEHRDPSPEANADDPFAPASQAMDDILTQLPASSHLLHEALMEASMIPPTPGDVILSTNPDVFSQASAEALEELNDRVGLVFRCGDFSC